MEMNIGTIFDWDGVITDSSRYHEESWERLAKKEGRSLLPNYFKESFGMRNENIRVFKKRVKKQRKKRK